MQVGPPKNVEHLQIFPFAGFVCWFCQCLQQKLFFFCFKFGVLRVQLFWLIVYEKSSESLVHDIMYTDSTHARHVRDITDWAILKWQCPWPCFSNFYLSNFSKLDYKLNERLLGVVVFFWILFWLVEFMMLLHLRSPLTPSVQAVSLQLCLQSPVSVSRLTNSCISELKLSLVGRKKTQQTLCEMRPSKIKSSLFKNEVFCCLTKVHKRWSDTHPRNEWV